MDNNLTIKYFTLSSSSEVASTIKQVVDLPKKPELIHIVSYLHNTVLVQSLKKELEKVFKDLQIIFLKHTDKNSTLLTLFYLDIEEQSTPVPSVVIAALHKEYRKKEHESLQYRKQLLSTYFVDNLTALPNVYQLRKDLEHNEEQRLILLKVDNFITINNFYGFMVGDYVMEEIAVFLKQSFPTHTVYRLLGAEFALTFSKQMNFYELKEYLVKMYEKLHSLYISYQESKIFIDFTMASAIGDGQENMFSKVSMALDYAEEKRVPFWIYEEKMEFENRYEKNFKISQMVRDAIKMGMVVPYYQAIVNNATGKIEKYECLARLIDSDNNVLSPALFIPIAKKIKVYNEITKLMIEKSFATFEENEFSFSINLSIEDIMDDEMYSYILNKLQVASASNRVTFELLESESIQDFGKVIMFVNEAKRYGAEIAIDDFGSGYSNFSYLIQIKANYIKIDGSLIRNIDVDNSCLLIVETVVEFAKKLGMQTVAEFVHSSVVLEKVKRLGIDYSQGFYIDEPSISLSK